ncbi:hypothetical protein PC128_g14728 [Phytophthora cactorum]|nr:hypothetical protein PC128_g14728 [Phytophthora cactorum]
METQFHPSGVWQVDVDRQYVDSNGREVLMRRKKRRRTKNVAEEQGRRPQKVMNLLAVIDEAW